MCICTRAWSKTWQCVCLIVAFFSSMIRLPREVDHWAEIAQPRREDAYVYCIIHTCSSALPDDEIRMYTQRISPLLFQPLPPGCKGRIRRLEHTLHSISTALYSEADIESYSLESQSSMATPKACLPILNTTLSSSFNLSSSLLTCGSSISSTKL